MKWTKLTLNTTVEALDYLGAIAMDLGLCGFEIEDNVPLSEKDTMGMFIDILPELPEDDGTAKVSFYVDEETDIDRLLADIKKETADYEGICDFGAMTAVIGHTDDADYINNWKKYFKPFRVDEGMYICPTWEELEDGTLKDNDICIRIDPGTAFGTGSHETTKLCLIAIKKNLRKDDYFLDVGCGSGILAISAMLLGAHSATGIDIDDNAARISVENAQINKIPATYKGTDRPAGGIIPQKGNILFYTGNLIEDTALRDALKVKKADVVAANILADIIIPLVPSLRAVIKDEGIFIGSGILTEKAQSVQKALVDGGFDIIETKVMGEWTGITAKARKEA